VRSTVITLLVFAFLQGGSAWADNPASLARKEIDRRLADSLRDAINMGATIFNNGNEDGCFWIYYGALTTALPLLDHRPDLKKAVEEQVAKSRKLPTAEERAFALRAAIDEIRAAIKRDLGGGTAPPPKSLWDRLGGQAGLKPMIHDLVVRAAADPKVNLGRNGKYKLDDKAIAILEQKLIEFLGELSGGPLAKNVRNMKDVHKGMAITDAEFDAFADVLKGSLNRYRVAPKEAEELLGLVGKTRKLIVEAPAAPKSLWERLGGEPAVKAVVKELVKTAAANPKVNFSRNGKYKFDDKAIAAIEKSLVEFISSRTGGPLKYTGKDMKEAHKGMGITEAEFNALADDLVAVLKKAGVAQKEIDDLVAVIGATKKDTVEK
jgi:hemoglobin